MLGTNANSITIRIREQALTLSMSLFRCFCNIFGTYKRLVDLFSAFKLVFAPSYSAEPVELY